MNYSRKGRPAPAWLTLACLLSTALFFFVFLAELVSVPLPLLASLTFLPPRVPLLFFCSLLIDHPWRPHGDAAALPSTGRRGYC